MGGSTHITSAVVRRGRAKARALLSGCLAQAIGETAPSHEAAARWMFVDASTIRRWLRSTVAINVEAVLASPKLGAAFRRALCVHDHSTHAASYVATRRSARRKSARKGAR